MIKLPTSHIENMKPEDQRDHGLPHADDDIIQYERKVKKNGTPK